MNALRQFLPLTLVCALSAPAMAGDEALYGPAAPPGSAFVRLFNDSQSTVTAAAAGDKSLGDLEPNEASDFVFLPAGSHTLIAGKVRQSISLKGDHYYTAVLRDGKVSLIENPRWNSRLKALVLVYNFTEGAPLELRTADGRPVIEAVAPDAWGQREVNAVRATFAIYQNGRKLMEVPPVALERGKAFSLFVGGSADHPEPVWVVS